MPENINLIPNEVIKERSLEQSSKKFTLISFIVFAVCAGISGIFLTLSLASSQELNKLTNEVSSKEAELANLKDVEKKGSELTQRVQFINSILDSRVYYSKLMEEVRLRSKPGITITNLVVNPDFTATISGTSSSTTLLQNYLIGLVNDQSALFEEPKLVEVSLKDEDNTASFKIDVNVKKDKISKTKL